MHSLAVKQDGTAWSWGKNESGQLGDGALSNRTTPVSISGLSGVTFIAAGTNHSLALRQDGTAWAWGANVGQLGDGTASPRNTPVQMLDFSGGMALAGGATHSLALRQDGTVLVTGTNPSGQLGTGTPMYRAVPVQVQLP
jgi:alpha-tubulin suppressor-like RCC1 family protein